MPDQREDVVNAVQTSSINYNTCFQSVLPRLRKDSVKPYGEKRPLGPDTYDAVIGLDHHRSISKEIEKDNHEMSKFKSVSPRFAANSEGSDLHMVVPGPGGYEVLPGTTTLLPSAADIHDPARKSMVFNSKVNRFPNDRNGGTGETVDSRDSTWTVKRDQKNYWRPPIWAKFTTTPRFQQGSQVPDNIHESAWNRTASGWSADEKYAPKENSYADLVAYDVDNTRLVNKYKTIANTAGRIPIPPRPKKSAMSPRSKFLDDLRVCNAPPLDFSFLQLHNLADLHMAMEQLVESKEFGNQGGSAEGGARVPQPPAYHRPTTAPAGVTIDGGGVTDGDDLLAGPAAVHIRQRVTAVRLNNNQFKDIKGVAACLAAGIGWKPRATPTATDTDSSKYGHSSSSSSYAKRVAPAAAAAAAAEAEAEAAAAAAGASSEGGVDPAQVRWLDLSHNQLDVIDGAELGAFSDLRVLNLQSNGIERLSQIAKLKAMTHLRTLTLFANPVEQKKNYRWYVIATLPHLTKLDATVITEKERHRARHWWKCRMEAKKRAEMSNDTK